MPSGPVGKLSKMLPCSCSHAFYTPRLAPAKLAGRVMLLR